MHRALMLTALLAGCADDPASGPGVTSHVEYYDILGRNEPLLDVLLVIDDTMPMASYQSALAALPSSMATGLDNPEGSQPDLRVFATTTAGDGALRQPSSTPSNEPFLGLSWDVHFNRATNFTGTFADELAALTAVGSARQGAVEPLEAARTALTAHADVLRENSMAIVITIAASDDASPSAIDEYVTFSKALHADPARIAVIGFYPTPATRLDTFHASFPNRGMSHDIEAADFGDALGIGTYILTDARGDLCVTAPADVDPATPGLQVDCDLRAYYDDGTDEAIRLCDADFTGRCIELRSDPAYCTFDDLLRVALHGFPGRYSPPIRGQCVVPGA